MSVLFNGTSYIGINSALVSTEGFTFSCYFKIFDNLTRIIDRDSAFVVARSADTIPEDFDPSESVSSSRFHIFVVPRNGRAQDSGPLISVSPKDGTYWCLSADSLQVPDDDNYVYMHGNYSGGASTTTGFSNEVWVHAAGIVTTSSDREVYINAGSSGEDLTSQPVVSPNNTAIGGLIHNAISKQYFTGLIAEVGIWRGILTPLEIFQLSIGVKPSDLTTTQPLVSYLPLKTSFIDEKHNFWVNHGGFLNIDHPIMLNPTRNLLPYDNIYKQWIIVKLD